MPPQTSAPLGAERVSYKNQFFFFQEQRLGLELQAPNPRECHRKLMLLSVQKGVSYNDQNSINIKNLGVQHSFFKTQALSPASEAPLKIHQNLEPPSAQQAWHSNRPSALQYHAVCLLEGALFYER